MASRSYNLAFDNPYNRKITEVLRKYEMGSDTNGEPDMMMYTNSRLQGGSIEPMEFKHPHMLHMSSDMPYTPLPRPLRKYADVSYGAGRPPGMVSPYVESVAPNALIDSGTSAVYPIYNALELKAVGGCCRCMQMPVDGGSKRGSKAVGKAILKEVVPIVKDIGTMAVKELTKEAIKSAFKPSKSGSGRKRKNVKSKMEPEPSPEMAIAIIPEGGSENQRVAKQVFKGNLKKAMKISGSGNGKMKRAEIVKQVMREKGMKMIEASKYVKANNLYQKQPCE